MKYSEFFIPTVKDVPSDAEIISHKLMIKAGMIKQSSAGIYSWLPLGLKVLKNIESIVREEQNNAIIFLFIILCCYLVGIVFYFSSN